MNAVPEVALEVFQPEPRVLYPLDMVSRVLGVSRHTILLYCKHGLISPVNSCELEGWYFSADAIRQIRRAEMLRSSCGGNLDAMRIILELQDEVASLQRELNFWRD